MTNEEKRDVEDHEFWKRVSELTGRRLVGWTWRQRATFEGLELPGDVAERIVALADIVAEKDAEIERLREAVEMAWGYFDQCCLDQRNMVPNSAMMRDTLAAYLRERDAVSSTDTRPPTHGVQSGVQEPEEGGQNA